MKKVLLIIAAMFAMAQMNVSAANYAANNEAATAVAAADEDTDNDWGYSHPFETEPKEHWSITTSGFYLGMGVKHNWDAINNSFEVGLLNVIAVKYNTLHGQCFSLGAGIHHRSYSIKRPIMLVRENGVVVNGTYPSENVDAIKNRSSNLNQWTVQFPLIFTQRIYKKLGISIAGIMNWNTYARVDNHYELDNVVHDIKFKGLKQNKLNFDIMGALTVDGCGLYCRYSPGKYFKEGYGPEIKNTWTLGLVLAL